MRAERPWFKAGIWPDVPKSMRYPEIPIFELLSNAAKKAPDKDAIVFLGKRVKWAELEELSDRFSNALSSLGVSKGDRVSLLLPNCPQFVISYYGALKAGGIVVAMNPLWKEDEIEYVLRDSGAEVVVTLDLKLTYPKIKKLINGRKVKLRTVVISSLADFLPFPKNLLFKIFKRKETERVRRDERTVFFKDLLEEYPPRRPEIRIDPKEDLALIQYTGGTTGLPKGVMLTHYNVVSNAYQARVFASLALPLGEVKGVVAVLPFFHIYGMTGIMHLSTLDPSTMILFPRADPEQILKAIDKYKPDYFPSITTLHSMLLERKDIKKYDLSSVKVSVLAAMAVPKKLVEDVREIMGGTVMEGYGLTEASPVTHINPLHAPRLGSMGIPIIDTDAKVVDPKGKEVPIGEPGELLIKGPQVMKGYWNKPEETSKVLRDGWLHTGDIVRMDADGYFYFVEREKDMIKYKGYSIFPAELEDVLYKHPAVALCAVVGVKDEKLGEIPKVYVVLKDQYKGKVSAEEIIEFCAERVAPYKRIREVEFRDDLPKSLIGKVLKRELRKT